MRISDIIYCSDFPCQDVNTASYSLPNINIDPGTINMILISEAAPANRADGYYAGPEALFARTTLLAFQDAGETFTSVQDLLTAGIYLTSAVKCAKTTYSIQRNTITHCSGLLERELNFFPNVKAYLLMGDVAIQAVNMIAKHAGQPRPIPAGATYKIRRGQFFFRGGRAFPSYLQAGPSYFIEKSKRKMIAEDITAALSLMRGESAA